ncbi:MAG: DUF4446 family protein [Actinomycetota bacterium]
MPDLTTEQLTLAVAVVAGVALLFVVVTLLLAMRLRKIHRQLAIVRGDSRDSDLLGILGRAMKQNQELDRRIDAVVAAMEEQSELRRRAIQRFGLVRYDAFEEMGGQLSFSAALLDDRGNGIVFTSINGRTETRTYAKPIAKLESTHNLSDEEREAIAIATSGREIYRQSVPAGR